MASRITTVSDIKLYDLKKQFEVTHQHVPRCQWFFIDVFSFFPHLCGFFESDNGGSWGHLWIAVLDFSCMSSGVNVRSTYDYLLTYLYYCFCNANLCTIPMIVRQTIILVENLIVIPCTPWYLYVLQLLIDYFFAGCKLQGWQVHRVSIDDIRLHSRFWQE